jgi:hypothetical protein
MAQSGHGTLITGSIAQGDARVHVNNNGGAAEYEAGYEQDCINETGTTIAAGQVVFLDWNGSNLVASSVGTRATGSVSSNGTIFTVSNPGDTGLRGDVDVASGYDGFGGVGNVTCAKVGETASYLE